MNRSSRLIRGSAQAFDKKESCKYDNGKSQYKENSLYLVLWDASKDFDYFYVLMLVCTDDKLKVLIVFRKNLHMKDLVNLNAQRTFVMLPHVDDEPLLNTSNDSCTAALVADFFKGSLFCYVND